METRLESFVEHVLHVLVNQLVADRLVRLGGYLLVVIEDERDLEATAETTTGQAGLYKTLREVPRVRLTALAAGGDPGVSVRAANHRWAECHVRELQGEHLETQVCPESGYGIDDFTAET